MPLEPDPFSLPVGWQGRQSVPAYSRLGDHMRVTIVAICALFGVAGCSGTYLAPPAPTVLNEYAPVYQYPEEVVGTWRIESGSRIEVITFNRDGTYRAGSNADRHHPWSGRWSVERVWSLDLRSHETDIVMTARFNEAATTRTLIIRSIVTSDGDGNSMTLEATMTNPPTIYHCERVQRETDP